MLCGRQWVSVLLTICHCSTSARLLFFTDYMLSPSVTVGLLETSYDDTYEATSRSRARSLSLYSLDGDPLGLSPFSRHRSLKKHLAASLASSRTSASRDNAGARVCPICPGFVVDIQVLMFVFSKDYKKKRIKKQKRVTRHFK